MNHPKQNQVQLHLTPCLIEMIRDVKTLLTWVSSQPVLAVENLGHSARSWLIKRSSL